MTKFGANALLLDIEGAEVDLLEQADLSTINKIFMELHYWPSRAGANRMLRRLMLDGFCIDLETSAGSLVSLHRGLLPA